MAGEQKPVELGVSPEFAALTQPEFDDKPQDECGVFGVYDPDKRVMAITVEGLQELQHRGSSGAGVAYYEPGTGGLTFHKGFNRVMQAIGLESSTPADSTVATGHVRYSTDDIENRDGLHPHHGHRTGIALSQNGHIEQMADVATRHGVVAGPDQTDSYLLTQTIDKVADEEGSLDKALDIVLPEVEGTYCLTIIDGERLIGVRDPWGTRPLALGELDNGGYALASESIAFSGITVAQIKPVRNIRPGEIITLGPKGPRSRFIGRQEPVRTCMFEFIYIARPDSEIDNINVYAAREYMGQFLAEDHPADIDIVVGVPDSGLAAAEGFALASGVRKVEGIFRNRYVEDRSFQQRGDKRKTTLQKKFHLNRPKLVGKRIGLVEDSIIKGSTMGELITMLREAGALEVHVRSAAPPYTNPCYGGMDTKDIWRLVARDRSNEEIAKEIDADSVAFNSLARVQEAIHRARMNPLIPRSIGALCTACTSGEYPYKVPSISELPLSRILPPDKLLELSVEV